MANNVVELRRPDHTLPDDGPISITALSAADDLRTAAQALERRVRSHGLRLLAWHDLSTMEPMHDGDGMQLAVSAFGWDDAALARWHNVERALRSPLVRACRVASEPFWINRDGIHSRSPDRSFDRLALDGFDDCVPAKAAIVLPVRMPFGQIAAAVLISADPARQDLSEEFARFAETLALPIHRFMRGYAMACRDERYLPTDSLLSSREIECLSWVAQGKTDFEISIILGCSHAGVRYHLTRVCTKLGAVNRAQSVFRACQLGYLSAPLQWNRKSEDRPALPELAAPELAAAAQ